MFVPHSSSPPLFARHHRLSRWCAAATSTQRPSKTQVRPMPVLIMAGRQGFGFGGLVCKSLCNEQEGHRNEGDDGRVFGSRLRKSWHPQRASSHDGRRQLQQPATSCTAWEACARSANVSHMQQKTQRHGKPPSSPDLKDKPLVLRIFEGQHWLSTSPACWTADSRHEQQKATSAALDTKSQAALNWPSIMLSKLAGLDSGRRAF